MKRIKIKRQQCKLTQSQLSHLSGVNIKTLQAYEQGEIDINQASALTVAKLAEVLNCDVLDLLERKTSDILDE